MKKAVSHADGGASVDALFFGHNPVKDRPVAVESSIGVSEGIDTSSASYRDPGAFPWSLRAGPDEEARVRLRRCI